MRHRSSLVVFVIVVTAMLRSATVSAHSAFGNLVPSVLGDTYATGWAHDENSGDGYAYFSARTFVDCAHTRVGYRQSADLFTGAYAHDVAGNVTSYLDAGILLQHDGLHPDELAAPDKVQLYAQASTRNGSRLLRYNDALPAVQLRYHIVCDTPLTMTMWLASKSEIDVAYDGTFEEKATHRIARARYVARVIGFVPSDGWSVACERCAVRRVVTLAVASDAPTRAGSYVGIRDVSRGREPVIAWDDSVEGRYRSGPLGDPQSYVVTPFHARSHDIVDSPRLGASRPTACPAIVVHGLGDARERLGLDERVMLDGQAASLSTADFCHDES